MGKMSISIHTVRTFVVLLSVGLTAWVFAQKASANTPPEVMQPYKAYRAALAEGNQEKASKKAYEAWKKAERLLGDSKVTGDLAFNFAEAVPAVSDEKSYERRIKAYSRSIELATFHENAAVNTQLERHLKQIIYAMSITRLKNRKVTRGGSPKYLKDMQNSLEKFGQMQSIYAGDKATLEARFYSLKKQYGIAIEKAKQADQIYTSLADSHNSPFAFALPIYLGELYEKTDKPILAALEYQKAMQKKDKFNKYTEYNERGRANWMRLAYDLESQGKLSKAEAMGLCTACLLTKDVNGAPIPIMRQPAITPPQAEKSGEVVAIFDLDRNGFVINPRIAASTDRMHELAVLDIFQRWRYAKADAIETDDPKRRDIVVRFVFELRNGSNRLFPSRKLKTKLDIPGGYESISPDATFYTKGSRVRVSY